MKTSSILFLATIPLSGCIVFSDPPISVERTLALEANDDFEVVAVANQAACAITSTGLIACFGRDTGNEGVIDVPKGDFLTVSGSSGPQVLFCGVTITDRLLCWGRKRGGNNPANKAPNSTKGWTQVTVGDQHACALDEDRRVDCWGDDSQGQLDVPDYAFRKIEAVGDFTCGITDSYIAMCWGGGDDRPAFLDYIDGNSMREMTVGEDFACSGSLQGTGAIIDCWVDEGNGYWDVPQIPSLLKLEAGNSHFCAINTLGELFCHGANDHGQLEPPTEDSEWIDISAGYEGTCGVTEDGDVHCWGIMPNPQRADY